MRVAITTSDGFTASGSAVDAARAAASYALLDEFSRFLERRVFSLNLWLLRRLLAEYFCHCETSLQQFIAQSSTQIAVGPMELAGASALQEAQRMLAKRKATPADSGHSSAVFPYLVTQVCTKKLSLLMNFFVEFCDGKEEALCEFIEEGDGVVTILPSPLPLAAQPYKSKDGIEFTSEEPFAMPLPPTTQGDSVTPTHRVEKHQKSHKIQPAVKALASSSSQTARTSLPAEFTEEQVASLIATAPINRSTPMVLEIKKHLITEVEKIEAQQPWRKVFNASKPQLPFDEEKYPWLAERLRTFWVRYGRAVWERSFWVPLSDTIDRQVWVQRKTRQRQASTVFEKIVAQCFEQLGPRFFYKLDRERHPGWWYRDNCVDLLALAGLLGPKKSLEYVQTQQHERFPDCGQPLPLHSANAGLIMSRKNSKGVSDALWVQSVREPLDEIKQQYVDYCTKKQRKEARKDKKNLKDEAKTKTRLRSPKPHQSTVMSPELDMKPSREELRAASAASLSDLIDALEDDASDSEDDDRMDEED